MAHRIIMPKQGLQMTEGHILQWFKQEGDYVRQGEPLFEMETDKLSITIDSAHEGTLLKIFREAGDIVPITETIAFIGEPGRDLDDIDLPASAPAEGEKHQTTAPTGSPVEPLRADGRLFSSPRARLTAKELQVDLTNLEGSGPEGMIITRDVQQAAVAVTPLARRQAALHQVPLDVVQGSGLRGKVQSVDVLAAAQRAQAPANQVPSSGQTVVPMTRMRRSIAEKMMRSTMQHAQANHQVAVDMTECLRMRGQLAALGIKAGINDFVLRCVAVALLEFPQINCYRDGDTIVHHHGVHLGMAVATDKGLLVPVIRDAHHMSLAQLGIAASELAVRTRENRITPDELSGSTFTVTNLGMLGVDRFTAILNTPESGILAVGAVKKQVVVIQDDQIVARSFMWLTLTYDHCVIDGAPAAQFLTRVRQLLENPALLM